MPCCRQTSAQVKAKEFNIPVVLDKDSLEKTQCRVTHSMDIGRVEIQHKAILWQSKGYAQRLPS